MFKLYSLKANGERLSHVGEKPAFFALTLNGRLVNYFGTLQAVGVAVDVLKAQRVLRAERTELIDLRKAA